MKSKIHNALAVAPTIDVVRAQILPLCVALTYPTTKVQTETEVVALRDPLDLVTEAKAATEQTEIAFVPISERQHTTTTAADTIITVGQRSQLKKKRKRNLASNGAEDYIEVFDYAVVPSLLDGGNVKEVGPMAKKRNKGKTSYFTIGDERSLQSRKNQHKWSTEIFRLPKPTISRGAVISHIHFVDTQLVMFCSLL